MNDIRTPERFRVFTSLANNQNTSLLGPWPLLMTGLALIVGLRLLLTGHFQALTTVMIGGSLAALYKLNRRAAIYALFAYLFLLGDIRRIAGSVFGFPKLDPLLLVGPVLTVLFATPILLRLKLDSRMAKWLLVLMTIMVLEIVNPKQGGITVGLTGSMFFLVPTLWFWIGARYGTQSLLNGVLFRVIVPLGVLASVLGLYQNFIGFLPWEQTWIDNVSAFYHALNVGGGFIRAFGFSVNGVEFINLLLVSSVLCISGALAGRRNLLLLLPILLPALFLASSRSAIIKCVLAISATWAFSKSGKGWAVRLPVALVVIVGVGLFSLGKVSDSSSEGPKSAVQASVQHQVNGLAHLGDKKYSTAGLHSQMVLDGISESFRAPLGLGLGANTLAGGKVSDTAGGSTEFDISDAFVSLGPIGGLLYVWFIFLTFQHVTKLLRGGPKSVVLPAFALLVAMFGFWIALGQYGMAPLVWFVIGSLSNMKVTEQVMPIATGATVPPRWQTMSRTAATV